jgi:hypothetical protein
MGLKAARATTFYQSLGIVFDPNKAHILVQKQGSAIPLELSAASTPFAVDNGDDTTWTSGSTGGLVLFANVDVAAGIGVLSSTSTIVGNTEMPLEAGKLTLATIR